MGSDALLGEQTREDSDLDLWLEAATIEPLFAAMVDLGIDRIFPWPGDRPWNFVLHDGDRLRIDLHCFEVEAADTLHYGAFGGDQTFPRAALTGTGMIGNLSVRFEQPEWAVRWHSGYPPRPVDRSRHGAVVRPFRPAPSGGLPVGDPLARQVFARAQVEVSVSRAIYPACMSDRPVFVLHEHNRPRHHFDLRLEEEGVLRSWAVPKGLPQDNAHDRLAIPVEDHEVDHATYEDDTKRIADTGRRAQLGLPLRMDPRRHRPR